MSNVLNAGVQQWWFSVSLVQGYSHRYTIVLCIKVVCIRVHVSTASHASFAVPPRRACIHGVMWSGGVQRCGRAPCVAR